MIIDDDNDNNRTYISSNYDTKHNDNVDDDNDGKNNYNNDNNL